MQLISSPIMRFDIDTKIQELKQRLENIKKENMGDQSSPKFFHLIQEGCVEYELRQLEAIRDRKFHVTIGLNIHCETFGTKEFPIAEFDLTDDFTVECAVRDFRRCEDGKKDSSFA